MVPGFDPHPPLFPFKHVEGVTLGSRPAVSVGRQDAVQRRLSLFLRGETMWKRVYPSCHLYLWWLSLEEECGRLR